MAIIRSTPEIAIGFGRPGRASRTDQAGGGRRAAGQRRWTRGWSRIWLGLCLGSGGCVHAPLNAPLSPSSPVGGYRFRPEAVGTVDSPLVVLLFFSGGGTRAAALSYGVLQELAHTPVPGNKRMLDRVASIFAISGGSFTAAYYTLYGDRIFQDYEDRFLKHDVQDALIWRCLNPANLVHMASPYYGRSDLAAHYYDRLLFHGATFRDLMTPDRPRPYLVISATDIVTDTHVEFTQDVFDLLNSDLASYPLSRAVAASTAVPFLLTPITLKNYAGATAPASSYWLHPEVQSPLLERPQSDILATARGYLDAHKRPYIHVMDGGLADNLGLSDLFAIMTMRGGWDRLMFHARAKPNARIAIVVVDAATEAKPRWSQTERSPTLVDVVSAVSTGAINRSSEVNSEMVEESISEWEKTAAERAGHGAAPSRAYFIRVNFRELASARDQAYFDALPTSLKLPGEAVDRLVAAGGEILRTSPQYQKLLADLAKSP